METGHTNTWDNALEHIFGYLGNVAADSLIWLALNEAGLTDLNSFLSLTD